MTTPISLSIITAIKGSTQKKIIADANGKPIKDGSHSLGISEGIGEDITVNGFQGFAELLSSLKSNQALVLGQTGLGKQRIIPKDKLDGQPNTIARTKHFYHWPAGYLPLLFDHDSEPGKPDLTAEQFWSELLQVFPEFAAAGRVVTVSTSSAIYSKVTGECIKPPSGHHTYPVVTGDVERFNLLFQQRCWLKGKAFFKLAKQNQQTGVPAILERFLADTAVFSPERLVYEAGALLEADSPFEQRLPEPQVFDGDYINLDALPDLTADEQAQAEANRAAARAKIEAQQLEQTCDRIRTEKPELGKREIKQVARQRIQSANQCLLEPDHMLYAMDGRCFKAGDIDSSYNGLKLKDPQEPSYRDGAQTAIIYASDNGWTIVSQAHGGCKYRLKHPVLGQSNKNLGRQIQRIYNRAAYRYWKRFGKLPDKPQPNPAQTNELYSREYIEQMSAAAAVEWEQQQQIEVGQSEEEKAQFIGKLEAKRGKLRTEVKLNAAAAAARAVSGQDDVYHVANQQEAIQKALKLGKRVLVDVTMTGGGKNFADAKLLANSLSMLGINKKITVLPDALNPSQQAYEQNYHRLDGRHLGTVLENGKKRRLKEGMGTDVVSIEPSNCSMADISGIHPILKCAACRFNHKCGKAPEGNEIRVGYGARYQAHEAWREPNIITSYGRLPAPGSDEFDALSQSWLTFDEARERVEISKTVSVTRADILEKQHQVEKEAPELLPTLSGLFDYLLERKYEKATDENGKPIFNKLYGIPLANVFFNIQSAIGDEQEIEDENGNVWVGKPHELNIDWDTLTALEDEFENQRRAIFGDPTDRLTDQQRGRLQRLQKKSKPNANKAQQIRTLEAKAEQAGGKLNRDDRRQLQQLRSQFLSEAEEYELSQLQEQHERTKFKPLSPSELRNKSALVVKSWLVDFLSVAVANQPGNIHFNPDGSFTVTVANDHHRSVIAAAKYVMLLGAYEARTNEEIAQRYGCHPNEVFIFDTRPEWQAKPSNLKIVQIPSLGKMGRQRGPSFEDARLALNTELERRNPGKHLNYDLKGQIRNKTHFIENSSDNEPFKQGVTSILTTVPRPNMAAKLAEYNVLTGSLADFDNEGFQLFYQLEMRNLILQTAGRFRAHWRQDEQLTLYVISEDELPVEVNEVISAAQITVEAAVGREKAWYLIDKVISDIAIAGENLTQAAIVAGVKALNPLQRITQGWLSELFKSIPGGWKRVKAIFNGIFKASIPPEKQNISLAIEQHSETNKRGINQAELDELTQLFTSIVELYQQGAINAAEVVKEFVSVALSLGSKVWRSVTASLPSELRSQLQSIVLEAYPKMPKWLGVPE